jgi:hypothetical protein
LFLVVQTGYALGSSLGRFQGWQQQSRQNGNDRDDNEEFNQRKRLPIIETY